MIPRYTASLRSTVLFVRLLRITKLVSSLHKKCISDLSTRTTRSSRRGSGLSLWIHRSYNPRTVEVVHRGFPKHEKTKFDRLPFCRTSWTGVSKIYSLDLHRVWWRQVYGNTSWVSEPMWIHIQILRSFTSDTRVLLLLFSNHDRKTLFENPTDDPRPLF